VLEHVPLLLHLQLLLFGQAQLALGDFTHLCQLGDLLAHLNHVLLFHLAHTYTHTPTPPHTHTHTHTQTHTHIHAHTHTHTGYWILSAEAVSCTQRWPS